MESLTWSQICEYGEVIITRNLVVGQALGLPTVEGYCIFMPKYVECEDESTPWRLNKIKLCRIIRGYGPRGVQEAVRKSGIDKIYEPRYGGMVPVVSFNDIIRRISPREAAKILLQSSINYDPSIPLILSEMLRKLEISTSSIGITGSYAGGYNHQNSDIDIIIYGEENILKIYNKFRELYGVSEHPRFVFQKKLLGGVTVYPKVLLSWRRGIVRCCGLERHVTWVGVDNLLSEKLFRQIRYCIPNSKVKRRLIIEPGQIQALSYPPWVYADNGTLIVSYEYNVGELLFKGGVIEVEGLASMDCNVLFLGLTEEPGSIKIGD